MKKRISTVLVAMGLAVAMAAPAMAQGTSHSSKHQSSQRSSASGLTVTIEVPTGGKKGAKKDKKDKKEPRRDKNDKNKGRNKRNSSKTRQKNDHKSSRNAGERRRAPEPEPEVEQVYAMADADFNQLLASLKAESFSSGKRGVLQMAAPYNYFSTTQVKTLIQTFSFSSDQVDAAVLLYPQVIDYQNFYQVMDVFAFESSKQEVRERLGL